MPFDLHLQQVLAAVYATASYKSSEDVYDRLEMEGVDFDDSGWRDENIGSLPEWHPCFYEIGDDISIFLMHYSQIMTAYRDILYGYLENDYVLSDSVSDSEEYKLVLTKKQPSPEKVEESFLHVIQEAQYWIFLEMDSINRLIWKDFTDV